jgi:hypothetical protein
MQDSTPSLRPNQSKTCEKIVVAFTIVPDSIGDHKLTAGAERTYRKMKRLIETAPGGALDWAVGRIIAYLRLPRGTFQDHRRELERAGLWRIERRRRQGCRMNESNIVRLAAPIKAIVTGGLKNQQQVKNINTKTTTPRASAPVTPPRSYARLRWEHQRAQNHPPAMRALYERNGALMDELRRRRVRCTVSEAPEERQARLQAVQESDRIALEYEAMWKKKQDAYFEKLGVLTGGCDDVREV